MSKPKARQKPIPEAVLFSAEFLERAAKGVKAGTPPALTAEQTAELVRIVDGIRHILWWDARTEGECWNPDKEWDSETIEAVAGTLEDAGLKPPEGMMHPEELEW